MACDTLGYYKLKTGECSWCNVWG